LVHLGALSDLCLGQLLPKPRLGELPAKAEVIAGSPRVRLGRPATVPNARLLDEQPASEGRFDHAV
jgi:hypothetical protein